MATYSHGANGAFSGKVGSVIGSSWRSIDYLRGLPKKSKKGASPKQLEQQARFALAATYLRPIKDVLNIGFADKKQISSSGYNIGVKSFLSKNILGDYPDFTVDFPNLVLSRGSLNPFLGLEMDMAGTELTFNWVQNLNGMNSFADDILIFVIYNETQNMYLLFDEAIRTDLTYATEIGTAFNGNTIHGWAFGISRDRTAVSNTQYLGQIDIPA